MDLNPDPNICVRIRNTDNICVNRRQSSEDKISEDAKKKREKELEEEERKNRIKVEPKSSSECRAKQRLG